MRHLLILLSILLLSFPLFGEDKPCYVSVTSSDDFNQTLLSNISISVISQYLKNVKPFPSSGLSGKGHCIYEVTATLDNKKTFVTLQGNNLNSFGDASNVGTDGFKESILRSLYRSQRDKRELICSDYPKILEECGGVVRKSAKTVVTEIPAPKKVKPRVGVTKEKESEFDTYVEPAIVEKKKKNLDRFFLNGNNGCTVLVAEKPRPCDWKMGAVKKRASKKCGGFDNWTWTNDTYTEYECKG